MSILPTNLTRTVSRQALVAKKNSPDFMFGVGIFSVVAGTFFACRATLKARPVIDSTKEKISEVKEINQSKQHHPSYSTGDYGKDLAYVYAMGAYDVLRLYGPAILLTGTGIAALTKSHNTLKERNASLTAAYAVISEAFEAYRSRVREELGEEKEIELYVGARKIEIEDESGDTKEEYVIDEETLSPYARFFDESSSSFQKDAEMNRLFIECQQNFANNLLYARGHVFLNDVYDMLGLERSSAGAVVGWVLTDEVNSGDNYIDFGIYEIRNDSFLKAWEPRVLLDFNVDGVVYDKIEKKAVTK